MDDANLPRKAVLTTFDNTTVLKEEDELVDTPFVFRNAVHPVHHARQLGDRLLMKIRNKRHDQRRCSGHCGLRFQACERARRPAINWVCSEQTDEHKCRPSPAHHGWSRKSCRVLFGVNSALSWTTLDEVN